jgi:hypothetical protein
MAPPPASPSLFRSVMGREATAQPEHFMRRTLVAHGSDSMLHRMRLERKLEGHMGCVNTVGKG